jgi:hypothetical protein
VIGLRIVAAAFIIQVPPFGRTKQTMILNILVGSASESGAKSIMKRYACPSGA